ncbi:beta-1,4-galactosyltransferase 1-like isoform X2 [Mercenaria mercenaria]|uniref:beta-1,4-galactosyltransferase 1-like isoform X2 n=1 Tax=Mercenaria mercenaria TaxID=6596 RepID=UPI00234E387C|nr:beta-1,4-galactosyltransferase 1-like isoform X2 [Mercenaria mercenaria]
MGRKVRDSAFLLCTITVTIWLYVFGKFNLLVADKVYVQPICLSSKLTSFYNISTEVVSWDNVENEIKNVQPGGHYTPKDCISTWKVAIIVPYRDRENHLRVFLRYIHPFLQQQQLEYGIFVIEMPLNAAFNRGLLMNVGFNESKMVLNYNCFIFHDVDLLPENIKNIYKCSGHPKHMASAIDTRNYTMLYKNYFGGVNAFSKDQFTRINGFPNVYFGWGREDDDLYHSDKLYKTRKQRYLSDGLSNLKYTKISYELRPLYTWILIGLNNHTGQVRNEQA